MRQVFVGVWMALLAAPVAAGPVVNEAAIRALMAEDAAAARERDVGRIGRLLAPDCQIALETTIKGERKTTRFTRDEYLGLLKDGNAALPNLDAYDYKVTLAGIEVAPDGASAVVTSEVVETVVLNGHRLVTESTEETTVAPVAGELKIIAVHARTFAAN